MPQKPLTTEGADLKSHALARAAETALSQCHPQGNGTIVRRLFSKRTVVV
jgi:hypothetical protein